MVLHSVPFFDDSHSTGTARFPRNYQHLFINLSERSSLFHCMHRQARVLGQTVQPGQVTRIDQDNVHKFHRTLFRSNDNVVIHLAHCALPLTCLLHFTNMLGYLTIVFPNQDKKRVVLYNCTHTDNAYLVSIDTNTNIFIKLVDTVTLRDATRRDV